MPDRPVHLKIDKFFWDEEFNKVHQWLDHFYPRYERRNPYVHWLHRHFTEALEKEFGLGTKEYNAGYVHILADMLSHFEIAFVPKTREELKEFLLNGSILTKSSLLMFFEDAEQ